MKKMQTNKEGIERANEGSLNFEKKKKGSNFEEEEGGIEWEIAKLSGDILVKAKTVVK